MRSLTVILGSPHLRASPRIDGHVPGRLKRYVMLPGMKQRIVTPM